MVSPSDELGELRARLANAEEALRAVKAGEVDTVLVAGASGPQVFTLKGAEHAYRELIESINEGALTLTADKTILYANQCFARMVKCPLEQVIGSSFRRFLSAEDRAALPPFLLQAGKSGAKIQVRLHASDGSSVPAQISVRPLASDDFNHATIGMVVTDMTEVRRSEEMLRALTQRVVQVQEAERASVALELHDNITQLLCGALFTSQALAASLGTSDGAAKIEAARLREMVGRTAEEVERISRNLRSSVLDQLGLVAILRATGREFTARTGVELTEVRTSLRTELSGEIELALYRIFQESLKNVEKHARARHVTMELSELPGLVRMTIKDDGIGFDTEQHLIREKGAGGLGLLGMRERATYVGGVLAVRSQRRGGTEIEVRVPLPAVQTEKVAS